MEISRILTQQGATTTLTEFDGEGDVAALSFPVWVRDSALIERHFELFAIFR